MQDKKKILLFCNGLISLTMFLLFFLTANICSAQEGGGQLSVKGDIQFVDGPQDSTEPTSSSDSSDKSSDSNSSDSSGDSSSTSDTAGESDSSGKNGNAQGNNGGGNSGQGGAENNSLLKKLGILPQTGERKSAPFMLGAVLIVLVVVIYFFTEKRRKAHEKN